VASQVNGPNHTLTMQVNGEAQNFTPPHHAENTYAAVIKIGRGDYVVDSYTYAKVRHDPPRGFVSAHA